jgi:hypothetical protein
MSPRMPTPVEMGTVIDKVFRITWSDGHRSTYSWKPLRLACPCAHCRGEWPVHRGLDPASVRDDLRAMRINVSVRMRYASPGGAGTIQGCIPSLCCGLSFANVRSAFLRGRRNRHSSSMVTIRQPAKAQGERNLYGW